MDRVSDMKKINDEIKQIIKLMQGDVHEGALSELQIYLRGLLDIKLSRFLRKTAEEACLEPITNDQEQYKNVKPGEQIADQDKPLTTEELLAGGWWCGDTSEACRLAFVANGVQTEAENWNDSALVHCAYKLQSDFHVYRAHMAIDVSTLKQIYRIGGNFYWSEK